MSNIVDQDVNQVILPESIIHTTDTDYIVAESDSWRLIPKISVVDDKTITLEEAIPDKTDVSSIDNDLPDTFDKILYSFGFKDLSAQYKSFHDTSGILSNAIDFTNGRYIELSTDIGEYKNSSIEFSIYDGITEYPILPKEQKTVQDELLISGLSTRFSIDTSAPVTIRKGGEKISDSYLNFDKNLLKDTSQTYTISYTPVNPYRLAIVNTSIRLKIIVRVYKNGIPPLLKNVNIIKSGGILQWQII
jgi:hypothetical protein